MPLNQRRNEAVRRRLLDQGMGAQAAYAPTTAGGALLRGSTGGYDAGSNRAQTMLRLRTPGPGGGGWLARQGSPDWSGYVPAVQNPNVRVTSSRIMVPSAEMKADQQRLFENELRLAELRRDQQQMNRRAFEADRSFGLDSRRFARGMFESDRSFGRGVEESDRDFRWDQIRDFMNRQERLAAQGYVPESVASYMQSGDVRRLERMPEPEQPVRPSEDRAFLVGRQALDNLYRTYNDLLQGPLRDADGNLLQTEEEWQDQVRAVAQQIERYQQMMLAGGRMSALGGALAPTAAEEAELAQDILAEYPGMFDEQTARQLAREYMQSSSLAGTMGGGWMPAFGGAFAPAAQPTPEEAEEAELAQEILAAYPGKVDEQTARQIAREYMQSRR
jgi:hypothetical protein